ncbi:arylsulfatase [Hyphomonas sp. WL0036]|uniref:arylsulfatase n=1 Tax=Hyphomonas sediminis TaxID=2866160 RepID=UPI001C820490|nr:arylsulfatase [Hyphomonas sediminis]MBY9067518.1 arylsulfatase [Hyphomonas sediminis]
MKRMLLAAVAVFAAVSAPAGAQASPDKPNFIVMVIDDAALMDLGIYGGEAATPNIDALANSGAMFTQYRSSPLCSPSRAMLLTGIDNHRTGISTIPEVLPPEHVGKPGYTMNLEPGVTTLAARLKPLGYRTLMTGKWHLGSGDGHGPDAHGFDRSFALDASGADNWEDKSYMPYYADAPWYEDGKPAALPADFYSSTFIVDKMMEYMDQTPGDAPFLAYMGFQAVHIPVQAPPEFTSNYLDTYKDGWEALQTRRWQRAQEIGLVPQGATKPALHPNLRKWEDLPEDQQKLFAARMAVNAGMLEAMDFHIGRLVERLKETGEFENTVFVITSDNGPEPSSAEDPRFAAWLESNGYHIGIEGIGEKGSYGFIGPEFASAASSPSYLFKFYVSEGGLRVPLIMSGPGIASGRVDSFAMVTDITPTLLEMAEAGPAPEGSVSIDGRSLVPVLSGAATGAYSKNDAVGIEVSGNSALYKGPWKIVRNLQPWGDGQWRLFNLDNDPGETADMAAAHPEIFSQLQADYAAYAARVGVLEVPAGYNSVSQVQKNMTAAVLKRAMPKMIALAIGGIILLGGLIWFGLNIRRGLKKKA